MNTCRAIVDKRDQRAFLPRPIPEDAEAELSALLGVLPIDERTHWEGWHP